VYAIRLDAEILPQRFDSWDEAVEAAQEDYALPPDADWAVVVASSGGDWGRSPDYGIRHAL